MAALVVCVAAPLARLVGAGFTTWDDDRFITANPLYWRGGWEYVRAAFTRVQMDAYHPLHLLSYLPDRLLWPEWAGGYHLLNLAIWIADVLLLWVLARRRAPAAAAFTACLLIALHPLRVEPVAWISARKDVLALLFFLLALSVEDRRDGARPSALALALAGAALLSKTSTVCFPLVLAAWLRWVKRAPWRDALLRAAPHALLAAAAGLAIAAIWRDHALVGPTRPHPPAVDVLASLATYTARLVWPARLAPIYPEAIPAAGLAAALAGAGLAALALAWRRLPPLARFAAVAYVAALLPVANVLPILFRLSDRYTLLAGAVLVVPLAALLGELVARASGRAARAALAAGVVAVAAAEVAVAAPLAAAWHGSDALWARAVAAQPEAYLARQKRGEILRDRGDWAGAIAEYQAMIRLAPRRLNGYLGLFLVYARRAEAQGEVAPGTAEYWFAELSAAWDDPERFADLRRRVARSRCAPCAHTLLVVGLKRWPAPDDVLLAQAAAALAAGQREAALLYLSEVRERGSPEFVRLHQEASVGR